MSAEQFYHESAGKTAKIAFDNAVDSAAYDCGHGGYTGTIAEKTSFIEIELPEGRTSEEYIEELFRKDDERIDNKWGPAGCILLKKNTDGEGTNLYMFFGWASN
jgi:hypothetical protein